MAIPQTLKTQVGGSHYKKYAIQPLEFAEKLKLSPIVFCIFKYVCRYKDKQKPVEDLQKALHCVDVFVEIGDEKSLTYDRNEWHDFLTQFEEPHAMALLSVLTLQSSKAYAETAKGHISILLNGVTNE